MFAIYGWLYAHVYCCVCKINIIQKLHKKHNLLTRIKIRKLIKKNYEEIKTKKKS